jgi:hypothetical protein
VLPDGQVEQHTSPFELQQIPTLFANFGKKFKHETVDNIPDLAPAVIIFGVMMGCDIPPESLSRATTARPRMRDGRTHIGCLLHLECLVFSTSDVNSGRRRLKGKNEKLHASNV